MPFASLEAKKAYDAARYAANREATKARVATYREANKTTITETQRQYRENNRDALRKKDRAYYQEHRKQRDAYSRRWALAHPDRRARHLRRWKDRTPERQKEYKYRRRARLRGATVVVRFDHEMIYERDGWTCQLCGLSVQRGEESIDHIVPVSCGGTHEPANVQLAHRVCNNRKGARL